MEEYVLALLKKHEPVNALTFYGYVTRDREQKVFNRSTLPHDLLEVILKLEDENKLKFTEKGIVSC